MVSHLLAMFSGHWFSVRGDITHLICYGTSQNRVVAGSCDFMSGSSSLFVATLPSLVAIESVVVVIQCV